MLFAEIPDNIGQVTGPIGTIFGGVVLLLYVYDKITDSRRKRRLTDVEVKTEELEADELPSKQYQRLARAEQARATRLEAKVSKMDKRIDELEQAHKDCEERFERQEHRCEEEIRKLREEGEQQRRTIDTMTADLNKMKQRLEDAGLGSNPEHPSFPGK